MYMIFLFPLLIRSYQCLKKNPDQADSATEKEAPAKNLPENGTGENLADSANDAAEDAEDHESEHCLKTFPDNNDSTAAMIYTYASGSSE